jgi:hypothetical protein
MSSGVKKVRLFCLLFLFSFDAFATSCSVTDEMQGYWNKSYASSIKVSIRKVDETNDVLVSFPEKIEGLNLSFVFLQLGDDDNPEFVSQLGTHIEDGLPGVYFTIKDSIAVDGYIVANYGADCGIQIYREVVFSGQT